MAVLEQSPGKQPDPYRSSQIAMDLAGEVETASALPLLCKSMTKSGWTLDLTAAGSATPGTVRQSCPKLADVSGQRSAASGWHGDVEAKPSPS